MILRRLAASLATAALVLGGALVGVPAAASTDVWRGQGLAATSTPSQEVAAGDAVVGASPAVAAVTPLVNAVPDGPAFSLEVLQVGGDARPGESFQFDIRIGFTTPVSADEAHFVALKIAWPDDLELTGVSGCEGSTSPGRSDLQLSSALVSGGECILSSNVMTGGSGSVTLFLEPTMPPTTSPLPQPNVLSSSIERLVSLSIGDAIDVVDQGVPPGPQASTTTPVTVGALYRASVESPTAEWVPGKPVKVEFGLSMPDVADDGGPLGWESATTVWEVTWPEWVTLHPDTPKAYGRACVDSDPFKESRCTVSITQNVDCKCDNGDLQARDSLLQAAVVAPRRCTDYCDYVVDVYFVVKDGFAPDVDEAEFTVSAVSGKFRLDGEDEQEVPAAWREGDTDSTILIQHFLRTSLELSAAQGLVDGEDVTASLRVEPISQAYETVVGAMDGSGRLAVSLKIALPTFLGMNGIPDGCDDWDPDEQVCLLKYSRGSAREFREIGFRVSMPTELPDPAHGAITVEAVGVEYLQTTCDPLYIDCEVPLSSVIPSTADFAVFEAPVVTSVELSSPFGVPGGEDVTATFRVAPRQAVAVAVWRFEAVVHVTWPDFLTPAQAAPSAACEGFVLDADQHGGVCTVSFSSGPGSAVEFSLDLRMPPESESASHAGDIAISGVRLIVTNPRGGTAEYPGVVIAPSSARFVLETRLFPVDVTLDRSASTPGGPRLAANVRVAFDRAVDGIVTSPVVGIELDAPDFLELVDPPGLGSCDEVRQNVCYLLGLREVGDVQEIELLFDMPRGGGGVGAITATGVRLCDGSLAQCRELPTEWVGSDAEQFTVFEPEITVDVVIDRDTGWTGGHPITATATVAHAGTIPETLPGLAVDLTLDWPGFLTPISIGGCAEILPGGACRVTGLDSVGTSKQITMRLAMPAVEPSGTVPSAYPATGDIRVSGFALSNVGAPILSAVASPVTSPPWALASTGQSVSDLTTITPQGLVDAIVGPGVTTSNIVYTGSARGAGRFSGFEAVGIADGLILSSGEVSTAVGPNDDENTTGALDVPGDADLEALGSQGTYDASVLTFDFVPSTSQLVFDYVFASEEYSENANAEFTDVLGFFVNGKNCALTPDGAAVSVNTINGGSPLGSNPQRLELFRDNSIVYSDDARWSPIDVEPDGLTTVLRCTADVAPNQINTMKLAIADSEESRSDSSVFIAAGSVRANHPPVAADQAVVTAEDTPTQVTLSATDADGDSLTYSVIAQPTHGALSGSGADLTYTPSVGYRGSDSFTFTAHDGALESDPATVSITVERGGSAPPPPPPPLPEPVVTLPTEWVGSGSVSIRVLQPKATIIPAIVRPGQPVTLFLENFPPDAPVTLSWTVGHRSKAGPSLRVDAPITQHSTLILRREALGARSLVVESMDGSFGPLKPAAKLLVVARSTVADELVGRGG